MSKLNIGNGLIPLPNVNNNKYTNAVSGIKNRAGGVLNVLGSKDSVEMEITAGQFSTSNSGIKDINLLPSRLQELSFFNRYGIVHPDNVDTLEYTHVFFTRPNMNLYGRTNNDMSYSASRQADMNAMLSLKPDILCYLDSDCKSAKSNFIIPMSNLVENCPYQDVSLGSTHSAQNMRGIKTMHGTDYLKSITDLEFSISFKKNRWNDIEHMIAVWHKYISYVKEGHMMPKSYSEIHNQLDYAISVYVMTVDVDGRIKKWGKYIGCYPKNNPISSTDGKPVSTNAGEGAISVNFYASAYSPLNPLTLLDFNISADYSSPAPDYKGQYRNLYEKDTIMGDSGIGLTDFYQSNVYVSIKNKEFYLEFAPKSKINNLLGG